jgi:hypothetical protein
MVKAPRKVSWVLMCNDDGREPIVFGSIRTALEWFVGWRHDGGGPEPYPAERLHYAAQDLRAFGWHLRPIGITMSPLDARRQARLEFRK